jgi:3-oxoacyl-[acyl-carrier protein] reductase
VRRLFDRAGDVDVLVACAGVHAKQRASISDTSDEDIARVIDVNLRGTFHLLREAARRMRDGGSIVTFSSSARHLGVPAQALYNATKAAVEQLSAALARELAGRDITVNCLSPGPTATSLFVERTPRQARDELAARTPLGRIGTPADIASVVSFLAGPDGRWVNGQTIRCTGGLV